MSKLRQQGQIREAVKVGLKSGLGAEDIAVETALSADVIRFHIKAMRFSGELKEIYNNGGEV